MRKGGRPQIKFNRGQSVLEFIMVFIAVLWLAVGIIRIWTWFNVNYANRQVGYENTHVNAGQVTAYNDASPQPVGIGSEPLDLTEDWVFQGRPSGQVRR
jgi:hypothetical protein